MKNPESPQRKYPAFYEKFVPIAIGAAGMKELDILGQSIAKAIKELKTPTLIVASSDMSHTQDSNKSRQNKIKKLDMSW